MSLSYKFKAGSLKLEAGCGMFKVGGGRSFCSLGFSEGYFFAVDEIYAFREVGDV